MENGDTLCSQGSRQFISSRPINTFVPSFPRVQFVLEQLSRQDEQSCQLLKSIFKNGICRITEKHAYIMKIDNMVKKIWWKLFYIFNFDMSCVLCGPLWTTERNWMYCLPHSVSLSFHRLSHSQAASNAFAIPEQWNVPFCLPYGVSPFSKPLIFIAHHHVVRPRSLNKETHRLNYSR